MKASNLRIGNWVTWFHPENGFVECKVDIDILNTMTSEYFEDSDTEVEPIPLTEEWLLNMPDWFRELISDGYMNFSECPTGYVDVKFVHTAQNLYFALTGEELEIK